MRIAILSDIHGNLGALQAVLHDLERRRPGLDHIVNLGDHASGPLFPLETTQLLMQQDWLHLAGNHERQLLTTDPTAMNASDAYAHCQLGRTELDWMSAQTSSAMLPGAPVLLCHGTPSSDRTYFLETVRSEAVFPATPEEIQERLGETTAELVACGHTHMPRAVRTSTGQLILNPGSVGLPAYHDDQPHPHHMQSGSPDARYAIVEHLGQGWSCELISLPYDFEPMARKAERTGRPDWARALRTGYA